MINGMIKITPAPRDRGERALAARRSPSGPGRERVPGRAARKRPASPLTCPRAGVRGKRSNRTAYAITLALSPFTKGEGNKYA